MSFKKILVAINNSSLGPVVFTAALEQAQLNKAALKLLHCFTTDRVAEPTVPMPFDPSLQPSLTVSDYQTQQILMEQRMEEAQEMLERYCQDAVNQGVPAEFECQGGDAGYRVCEEAKAWEADLIVIGRKSRTGLEEVLLGSVSNYVVHHAPCSVLIIQKVDTDTAENAISDLSTIDTNPASSYPE